MQIKKLIFLLFLSNLSLEVFSLEYRTCTSCNRAICSKKLGYYTCDEHVSCRFCLRGLIVRAIDNKTWPSCASCNESLAIELISKNFPLTFIELMEAIDLKNYENLLLSKQNRLCSSCNTWIGDLDKKYFSCDSHFACQGCIKKYIKKIIKKKITPTCLSCDKPLDINVIEINFPKLFKLLIKPMNLEEYSNSLPLKQNRHCKSCDKWIYHNDYKYFGCDEHFSCENCLDTHIRESIKNNTWPTCISCEESLDTDFLLEEFPYFFSKDNRFCQTCKEWIPKESCKYFFCSEHFSCKKCLNKHIKSSLKQNEWPSCISCEKILDKDFCKEEFPKLHKNLCEVLKENYSCSICFDLTNPLDRSYHCEEHWSCKPCFKSYIKEWINDGKIPIKCFDMNCENLINLEYMQKNYPEYYRKMIEWYDEHAPENIREQNFENQKLLVELLRDYYSTFTQCPTCGFVIEKMSGCNWIRCKACRNSFNFVDGRHRSILIINGKVSNKIKLNPTKKFNFLSESSSE